MCRGYGKGILGCPWRRTVLASDCKSKSVAQKNQMVSGSLALLFEILNEIFLFFCEGKQGSGPDGGQSPVECGDFPYVPS